jgi:hypothetical protein
MSSTATTCAIVQSDRAFVGPRAGFGEDRFQPGGPRLGRQHARRELRPDPPLPLFALWGTLARSMSDTGVGADSKSVCRMYGSVVVLEYEVIRRARRPVKRVSARKVNRLVEGRTRYAHSNQPRSSTRTRSQIACIPALKMIAAAVNMPKGRPWRISWPTTIESKTSQPWLNQIASRCRTGSRAASACTPMAMSRLPRNAFQARTSGSSGLSPKNLATNRGWKIASTP